MGSREFCLQSFGEENADRYEYRPIVRKLVSLEDTENYFQPPFA